MAKWSIVFSSALALCRGAIAVICRIPGVARVIKLPEDTTGVIILDRGMNRDECRAMCISPRIPLREKLYFRMIYEIAT